ncbi:MAG: FtsB family cell division protein [Vagococcus sp.]
MKKDQKLLAYDQEQQMGLSMKSSQKDQKKLIFRRRRLAIMFAVAFVVFSIIGINLFRNGQHLVVLQKNREEVVSENKQVAKTKKDLEREVNLLNDDEYVEKMARSKYFYSKEGEQVYSIPDLSGSTQTSGNK